MSNVKCVMFDLDGTLLNTLDSITYYCNETLKMLGAKTMTPEICKGFVGHGAENLIKRVLEYGGINPAENFDKAFGYYNKVYNNDPYYLINIYEGINELITELKNKGLKLAVLSNKPHYPTCEIIKKYFGENFFDAVYGARDGFPKKPDPSVPLAIAKELSCEPSECIYVGDSGSDMQTGKNSGFFTIGVLWGFRDEEDLRKNNADAIVSKAAEILELI